MRTDEFLSVLFGVPVDWYNRSRRLLLSTYFDHTSLLTTLHQSRADSLMRCVSASSSDAISGVRRLVLSTSSTVEICLQHSTLPFLPQLWGHRNNCHKVRYRKPGVALPDSEKSLRIRLLVSTQYTNVTVGCVAQRKNIGLWPENFRCPALDLQLMDDHLCG